jgi:ribosomal protein S27AE
MIRIDAIEKIMTAYKRNQVAWLCIIAAALSMGTAAVYISNWLLVPFTAIIYSGHFFLKKIKCPNCATPLTFEGESPSLWMRIRTAFRRRACAKCGWNLDKNLE